jgi:hypothetical protein
VRQKAQSTPARQKTERTAATHYGTSLEESAGGRSLLETAPRSRPYSRPTRAHAARRKAMQHDRAGESIRTS